MNSECLFIQAKIKITSLTTVTLQIFDPHLFIKVDVINFHSDFLVNFFFLNFLNLGNSFSFVTFSVMHAFCKLNYGFKKLICLRFLICGLNSWKLYGCKCKNISNFFSCTFVKIVYVLKLHSWTKFLFIFLLLVQVKHKNISSKY